MKKMLLYFITVIIISVITFTVLIISKKDYNRNLNFIKSYGWEIEEDFVDYEEIIIPEMFDDVYNKYNQLQKDVGLDLSGYKGKKAKRYSYKVINYPIHTEGDVFINLICINGNPVAGDVMTVKLDGFMHSLKYPDNRE